MPVLAGTCHVYAAAYIAAVGLRVRHRQRNCRKQEHQTVEHPEQVCIGDPGLLSSNIRDVQLVATRSHVITAGTASVVACNSLVTREQQRCFEYLTTAGVDNARLHRRIQSAEQIARLAESKVLRCMHHDSDIMLAAVQWNQHLYIYSYARRLGLLY